MGKFSYVPRTSIKSDSDIIRDIHLQLSQNDYVVIVYDNSKISLASAKGLLKKIPPEDVFKVRIMEQKDFENHRRNHPSQNYYQISANDIPRFIANIPDLSN